MSLLRELERVRSRVRSGLLLRGVFLCAGSILLSLLAIGGLDWLWQPEELISRWSLLIALLACVLTSFWYFVVSPWNQTLTTVDVALQLERLQPQWQGQLAAAVALNDEFTTVPALHPPLGTFRWRPLAVAFVPLLIGITALGMLWWTRPQLVQIGFARTLLPMDSIRWPRHTELQMLTESGELLSPGRPWSVDARHPLTLSITDREGLPPNQVELQLKFPSGQIEHHTLNPVTTSTQTARGEFQFSWLPTPGTTWVRVRGGDDETVNWCPIEAVTAPIVTQAQVTLTYPEYLQLPPRELSSLPARLSVPVGTTVQVDGTLDRPVQELHVRTTSGESQSLELEPGNETFTWQSTITPGPPRVFWFEPVDASGRITARPPRHELIPIADALPEAQLLIPDRDLLVTPHARIPWEIQLRDDDRITEAELLLAAGDDAVHTIWKGVWNYDDVPRTVQGWLDLQAASTSPDDGTADPDGGLELRDLEISPDAEVLLTIRARDSHPGEDRWIASPPRVLRIVSTSEKLNELEQRVAEQSQTLTEQGEQLARNQQLLRELRQRAQHRDFHTPEDAQLLASCNQWLTQFSTELSEGMGIRFQLQQIIEEARQNRLPDTDLTQPLSDIEAQLAQLHRQEIAALETAFRPLMPTLDALKSRQDAATWPTPSLADLTRAELAAESLRQGWEEMLVRLARWSRQLDFRERFDELYAAGQILRENTLELAQRTLARPAGSLNSEERAELARLVQQYQQLAIDAEQLQRPSGVDLSASPLFQSAHQRWQAANAASQFHRVVGSLQNNNMGQALQRQTELQRLLEEIRNLLHESGSTPEDSLFEKLTRQREEAEILLNREQQLTDSLREATLSEDAQSKAQLDRLIKQSEDLLQQAQRLRRQLQSMHLDAPTQPLDRVAEHLQTTRLQLAIKQRNDALNQLEQAQNQTESVIRTLQQLEQQVAATVQRQHLLTFSQSCAELAARQNRVAEETRRLRELQTNEGRWTRGQLKTLLETTTQQTKLVEELTELQLLVRDLSLVQAVTNDIVTWMTESRDRLKDRDVSLETEHRQRRSEATLMALADSLASPPLDNQHSAKSGATDSQAKEQLSNNSLSAAQASELRLLLALQDDLQRRTREFVNRADSSPQSDEIHKSLLQEQRQLAIWARKLLDEPSEAPGEVRP